MLKNLKQIQGRALRASDGTLGEVKDFYFDDVHWHIRYLVVETGAWLNSRRVLISTDAISRTQPDPDAFSVDLTTDQVRESPELDANNPVADQQEASLRTYYGWPSYWDAFANVAAPIINTLGPGTFPTGTSPVVPAGRDPHLRSASEMMGWGIEATDGAIGHVDDFLVNEKGWTIRYLVIDTTTWFSGGEVIVAPSWIRNVSWEKRTVALGLTRESVKASPPYESSVSWNREYMERLHEYYGFPRPVDMGDSSPDATPAPESNRQP